MSEIKILWEDQYLVVIDKPAGVVVNRAESVKGETLQDWFEKKYENSFMRWGGDEEWSKIYQARSGLVHRLDKETSGAMVMAKNPEVLISLMKQFKRREVKKEYLALVHGKVEPTKGDINLPIGRSVYDRRHFTVMIEGRQAKTNYEVEGYYEMGEGMKYPQGFSLVRCKPVTGRTHQIRVHMRAIGHPLVADSLYVSKKRLGIDLSWCKRHFLHAAELGLRHPVTSLWLRVKSGMPQDLKHAIKSLSEVSNGK